MSRRKPDFRPDLALAVEMWGTIVGAVDKLTWLRRVEEPIAAGMAPDLLAVRQARHCAMNPRTGLRGPAQRHSATISASREPVRGARWKLPSMPGCLRSSDKADADAASAPRSTGSPCRRMHRLRGWRRMDI